MPNLANPDILIIGGAHIDRIGRSHDRLEPGQSNPGHLKRNVGGVASNIAQCLAKLDWQVALSSIRGQDADGDFINQHMTAVGIDISGSVVDEAKTSASYTAIEDSNGSLIAAIADMAIYDAYPADAASEAIKNLPEACYILVDTNLPGETLATIAEAKGSHPLIVSAVSGPKANRAADILDKIDILFCNEAEAAILAEEFAEPDALPELLIEAGVKSGVITRGDAGVSAWQNGQLWALPAPPVKVRSTNGAGDTLAASVIHALLLGESFEKALSYGLAGASLSLMSEQSVPDMLTRPVLASCIAETPTSEPTAKGDQ